MSADEYEMVELYHGNCRRILGIRKDCLFRRFFCPSCREYHNWRRVVQNKEVKNDVG